MKVLMERIEANSKGREIRFAIVEITGAVKPYELIRPGSYPRRFKSLKAAEKAFNR